MKGFAVKGCAKMKGFRKRWKKGKHLKVLIPSNLTETIKNQDCISILNIY